MSAFKALDFLFSYSSLWSAPDLVWASCRSGLSLIPPSFKGVSSFMGCKSDEASTCGVLISSLVASFVISAGLTSVFRSKGVIKLGSSNTFTGPDLLSEPLGVANLREISCDESF